MTVSWIELDGIAILVVIACIVCTLICIVFQLLKMLNIFRTFSRGFDRLDSKMTFDSEKDFSESVQEAFRAIRERMANGGPGWAPAPCQCPCCVTQKRRENDHEHCK